MLSPLRLEVRTSDRVRSMAEPILSANAVFLPPRPRRLPARYVQNALPEGPAPFALEDAPEAHASEHQGFVPRVVGSFLQLAENVRVRLNSVRTRVNGFGLSRLYYSRPDNLPDAALATHDLIQPDLSAVPPATPTTVTLGAESQSYDPYPNRSSWLLGRWYHSSAQKSKADFKGLTELLESEDFDRAAIRGVQWDSIENDLAIAGKFGDSFGRGWKRSTVRIRVPTGQKHGAHDIPARPAAGLAPDAAGRPFDVEGVFHRSIVSVIKSVFGTDPVSKFFHHIPFAHTWTPPMPGWANENVFGELYSSKAFRMAHDALQALSPEPGCTLPRVVCAIMLGSDETHLTQFGDASLWPLYGWFGNQSKYDRAMPSKHALHPIAFLQKVNTL